MGKRICSGLNRVVTVDWSTTLKTIGMRTKKNQLERALTYLKIVHIQTWKLQQKNR